MKWSESDNIVLTRYVYLLSIRDGARILICKITLPTCVSLTVTLTISSNLNCNTQPPQTDFITGQNEREETTQNTIVTKSAACASYEPSNPNRSDSDSEKSWLRFRQFCSLLCPSVQLSESVELLFLVPRLETGDQRRQIQKSQHITGETVWFFR